MSVMMKRKMHWGACYPSFYSISFPTRAALIQQQCIQEVLSSDPCQEMASLAVVFHDMHTAFKCTPKERLALATAVSFTV
jgi:hypothetical protein